MNTPRGDTTGKYENLWKVSQQLRNDLDEQDVILIYAFNGVGKTRLSMEFNNIGKKGDNRDTLYFNAYTEDLFTWDNRLNNDNDEDYKLNLNKHANNFFEILLYGSDVESKIYEYLNNYAELIFTLSYRQRFVKFWNNNEDTIKISRGEQNMFIWCFFLAISKLIIEDNEAYKRIKYIYIDDPISSLDDNNAISVACDLVKLIDKSIDNKTEHQKKFIISTHHNLFLNVVNREINNIKEKNIKKLVYFLDQEYFTKKYLLKKYKDSTKLTIGHLALLKQLYEAVKQDEIYPYHFNILRSIIEKTAIFHGLEEFSDCLLEESKAADARILNLMSHGDHSPFEPKEIDRINKEHFKRILKDFLRNHYRDYSDELAEQDDNVFHQ